jgi:hypothetical protein
VFDGDGDVFELVGGDGGDEFFDSDYPLNFDGSSDGNNGFAGLPGSSKIQVGFSYKMYSGHWSTYAWIADDHFYNLKTKPWDGVSDDSSLSAFAFGAGEVGTNGTDLIYGTRHPGATNYNGGAVGVDLGAGIHYDDGSGILEFDPNPKKVGAYSSERQWQWDGTEWNSLAGSPVYTYDSMAKAITTTVAGGWNRYETSFVIPYGFSPASQAL